MNGAPTTKKRRSKSGRVVIIRPNKTEMMFEIIGAISVAVVILVGGIAALKYLLGHNDAQTPPQATVQHTTAPKLATRKAAIDNATRRRVVRETTMPDRRVSERTMARKVVHEVVKPKCETVVDSFGDVHKILVDKAAAAATVVKVEGKWVATDGSGTISFSKITSVKTMYVMRSPTDVLNGVITMYNATTGKIECRGLTLLVYINHSGYGDAAKCNITINMRQRTSRIYCVR